MNDLDVRDVYTESVTLWRFMIDKYDWWQIYDDNSAYHQVCRLSYDDDSGEDVWRPEGYVSIPKASNNEEKQKAYLNYISNRIKGLDG